jgi:NTP pyrophosphatase (non-canonical NTP hydrolase)
MIIGIAGKARSGKDTIAKMIVNEVGGKVLKFAEPLKAAASAMTLESYDKFEHGDRSKEIEGLGISYRRLLQLLGTEVCRAISEDFWVNVLHKRIISEKANGCNLFVISDVRFENEADYVRRNGGAIIHVKREQVGQENVPTHASEAGLETKNGDYVIENNGTLGELEQKVVAFLEDIGLMNNAQKKTFPFEKEIVEWARERGILDQSDAKTQCLKFVSEAGELADNVAKGRHSEAKDDIGDIIVTLVVLSHFLDLDIVECIEAAYQEIAKRKGKIVNGTFVKE